jgi:kexin
MVKDTEVNDFNGTFVDWHLKLWGESIDASKATLLPMPSENDDADHTAIPTTTIAPSTTTLPPSSTTTSPPTTTGTDHPDRPVNSKPTGTGTGDQPQSTGVITWLPSFLPTFGASASTVAWVYGSLALIIIFCSGLGIYMWLARRRRLRNSPRDDYEFELLDEEEAEGLASGEKSALSASKKRGRKTRGGELYDAFAGGSDDEDEDGFGSGQYHDERPGDSSGSLPRQSEKRQADDDEEELHHVIGDDDSEEDDDDDRRPLGGGAR